MHLCRSKECKVTARQILRMIQSSITYNFSALWSTDFNLFHIISLRSLRNLENGDVSILDQFEGLKAIHYVGEIGGGRVPDDRVYEGEGNQQNQDGVFR